MQWLDYCNRLTRPSVELREVTNVLVVEADPILRNLVIRALSRLGFIVYEAANTEEALLLCNALADHRLDLIITDHETADPETTDQILASCATTKVLQISESPFGLLQKKQALVPGSSFLKKPFTTVELLDCVRDLLNPRMQ